MYTTNLLGARDYSALHPLPPYAPSTEESSKQSEQLPLDLVDEESMESFPCSDPPSYSTCHV